MNVNRKDREFKRKEKAELKRQKKEQRRRDKRFNSGIKPDSQATR